MEFAIKLVAMSWCDVDELGRSFHEQFDGTLAQRDGEWFVTVYQEGSSARTAARRVIASLETLGFSVRRVDRDLVDIPEIALRLGRKRQNIHQFATGNRRGSFPAPYAYLGGKRVWTWTEVAAWANSEIGANEEPGLLQDDAASVDAFLAGRRDKVQGEGDWAVAVHSAEVVSSQWGTSEAPSSKSYRRTGVDISAE